MEVIEEAWEILSTSMKLSCFGQLPPNVKDDGALQKQEEWLVNLELALGVGGLQWLHGKSC